MLLALKTVRGSDRRYRFSDEREAILAKNARDRPRETGTSRGDLIMTILGVRFAEIMRLQAPGLRLPRTAAEATALVRELNARRTP